MPRSLILCALAALSVTACERRHEAASRDMAVRVLRGVLVYPGSSLVNFAAGTDAAQVERATAGWRTAASRSTPSRGSGLCGSRCIRRSGGRARPTI